MAKVEAPSHIREQARELEKKNNQLISNRVDRKLYKPGKYELTGNETFDVVFRIKEIDGIWTITNDIDGEEHFVRFRMWNYKESLELTKMAYVYDQFKKMHYIDNEVLDKLKIQRLLKEWSFEKDNENLKIIHVNGVLVDECYENFMRLHFNIVQHIIYEMNKRLG